MSSASQATEQKKCFLEPINLHNEDEAAELLRQRIICTWDDTPEYIANWREAMDANLKALFWIKPTSHPDLRIGHVSLDSEASPPDLELANPHDRSVLTIANLFILPEHRGGGTARVVLGMLEETAREEPYGSKNCKAIAITTMCGKYHEDDEWRARYEYLWETEAPPRGRSNEAWYVRMGFVKWKEEPRYKVHTPGREGEKLVASFMRKSIV